MDFVHRITRRRAAAFIGATAGSFALPRPASAQAPLAMVRLLLAPPAGSAVDALARKVADEIKPGYAANSMVENRPGAGGIIAVAAAKDAPADGSTILVSPASPITIYPLTYKKLPYNPQADLTPVSLGATFDLALAVGPMVPASVKGIKDFFAWCKAEPAKASFGSPGQGTVPHFVGSMTSRRAGVDLQHVAYKGPSPAVVDMMSGQIAAVLVPLGDVLQVAAAGKCRILAVTGAQRSRFVPQVPTFAEQGYGEFGQREWIGFFVPSATPPAVVQHLNAALKTVLAERSVVAVLEKQAMEAQWSPQREFAERIEADRAKWGPVVKALNFTAES